MSEKKIEDGEERITSSELERVITDRDYAFLKTQCGGPHALAELLESNPKSGLTRVQRSSSTEGKRREREVKFGKNEFEYPPPKTF